MNSIEIKPIGTFQPLDSNGINYSRTANEWNSLCKTFGFRYDENDDNAAVFYHYDNGTTATIILTQEDIPVLKGMHNTDASAHTLYSKLIKVLEATGCDKLFVKTNQIVPEGEDNQ
jgi:hypothetical protein